MNLVVGHTRSDFDAIGATVAAARLYAPAVPVLHKQVDGAVRAFLATHKDALGLKTLAQLDLGAVRRVIVVDTQTPGRLGPEVQALLERPEVEAVVFDHHPTRPVDLPAGPGGRIEATGSASGLLACLLEARGLPLGPVEATAVALGIHADTGSLLYPGAAPADARGLAYAMACGADLRVVAEHLETPLDAAQREALARLEAALRPAEARGVRYAAGAIAAEAVEGFARVVERAQDRLELDAIAAAAVPAEGKAIVVGRAKRPDLDLLGALAPWGARGHAQAASATLKGADAEALGPALLAALEGALPPTIRAADLMSAPVRTIPPETIATEARSALERYGHTAFVVLDGPLPVGVVSRRDLDRAIHHGLGHAPVKGFMSRRVVSAAPDTPLEALEALMTAKDIGRLPILTPRGALVGIVTRSDVLRVRYAKAHPAEAAVRARTEPLADTLARTWPAEWVRTLREVSETAGGRPVYLVGGAVRDLLLGRANLDVDLVTEASAIELAEALAERWPDAALHRHAAFGTARLTLPDGRKLDVATARTEFYPHPGALPEVEFASLKQDLVRRDFAVNALAMALHAPAFGELIDFFEGHADLDARRLRVLHPLSFVEDPTRLLRGVRFELQLGFALAPETERLGRAAMETGRFDGVGGERNKIEWHRLFDLPRPDRALARAGSLGALRMLGPALAATPGLRARFRWLARALPGGPRHLPAWAWLLAAAGTGEDLPARLNLPGSERKAIARLPELAARAAGGAPLDSHRAIAELAALGPWARVAALGLMPDRRARRALSRRFEAHRPMSLPVTGETLRALGLPPGPAYARLLDRLKTEVLEGRLAPEAAAARAAELVREERREC